MPQPVTYFSHVLGRFDRDAGVIHGVSIITEGMAKGHGLKIDNQTLLEVKHAAESLPDGKLKCKLNHKSGVDDVFGYVDNFRVDGPKLLGDLHMFKSHQKFEQTFEQLESLPNHLGLSVAFVGPDKPVKSRSGESLARCKEILSADLVPEPAANPTGLFESKVDTTNLSMNDTTATNAGAATDNQGGGDYSLNDVMDFLTGTLMPRLESVEAFQSAIQAELENAENVGEGEEQIQGDDGNQSFQGGFQGNNGNGGTDQNGGFNPHAQASGAPAMSGAAAEFNALRQQVVNLERQAASRLEAEQRHEFEAALGVIDTKVGAVIEFAERLQQENEVLRNALNTGTSAVRNSPENIFLSANKTNGTFEALVQGHVAAGKKKSEAILLARKENPQAHNEFLARQGVINL